MNLYFASKKKKGTHVSIAFLQMIRFHGKPHIFRESTNSCNDFQCLTSDWLRKLLTPQTLYKKSPATFSRPLLQDHKNNLSTSSIVFLSPEVIILSRQAFFPSLTWKGQKLTPRHDLGKQTFEKKKLVVYLKAVPHYFRETYKVFYVDKGHLGAFLLAFFKGWWRNGRYCNKKSSV